MELKRLLFIFFTVLAITACKSTTVLLTALINRLFQMPQLVVVKEVTVGHMKLIAEIQMNPLEMHQETEAQATKLIPGNLPSKTTIRPAKN